MLCTVMSFEVLRLIFLKTRGEGVKGIYLVA